VLLQYEFQLNHYPAAIGGGNTQAADWDRAKARSLVGGSTIYHQFFYGPKAHEKLGAPNRRFRRLKDIMPKMMLHTAVGGVYNSNSLYDRIKLTLYSALESCCSYRTRAAPSLDGAI